MYAASAFAQTVDIPETAARQQIALAEKKKSRALKLFCAPKKTIVLPQQESTTHSGRERIDLSFTVSQQYNYCG